MKLRIALGALLALLIFAAPAGAYRATFYYPWFPEAWSQNGKFPYTHFNPSVGLYDYDAPGIVRSHLLKMQWGGIDVAISSWWGQGSRTDSRVPLLLDTTEKAGSPIKWTLYYEPEGYSDPTPAEIQADLDYIQQRYASHPSYLTVNGKPVIFVWTDSNDACDLSDRWAAATQTFYVSLKVFSGRETCASQPDTWHQYAPAVAETRVRGSSYSISPGFWLADDPNPRLPRQSGPQWGAAVKRMVASGEPWQLITTFNEWGEGTAVEPADQWAHENCNEPRFALRVCTGLYLNYLHRGGAPPDKTARVAAAGDIACNSGTPGPISCRQKETSDLLGADRYDAVLLLGDNQYENGELSNFNSFFDPTWGRFKSILRPSPGNHEYKTPGAAGYFAYFGNPQPFYSFDIGEWHFVSLNSSVSMSATSPQVTWLRSDLALHTNSCTLAYYHHPHFTDGAHTPDDSGSQAALWDALYQGGVDLVLNGHDHNYQRWSPRRPDGTPDDVHGIREFVVGTGGRNHTIAGGTGAEVKNSTTFGVLDLKLKSDSYLWRFVPEKGSKPFTDQGGDNCHDAPLPPG